MLDLGPNDTRRLALETETLHLGLLLYIDLPGTPLRATDLAYDYDDGANTWINDEKLVGVSVPEGQDGGLNRDLYSVAYADDGSLWASLLAEGYTGRDLTIDLVFLAGTDNETVSAPLRVYKGSLTGASYELGAGGSIVTLVAAGELSKLDGTRVMLTTESNQGIRDPGDTCMRYVEEQSRIVWGRRR